MATATPGTLIPTATAGATDVTEAFLWVLNTHTGAVDLTIEWGGVTDPDDLINVDSIPVEAGAYMVIPGWILNGGLIVRAFASQANVLVIFGYTHLLTE